MFDVNMDSLRDGTITALGFKEGSMQRMVVWIEEEYSFELSVEEVRNAELSEGDELTVERQQKLIEQDKLQDAKSVALNYISYKPRTKYEVRRRLEREEYPENLIEDVIAYLESLEYLDDHSYARLFAEERFSSKGYGPYRVRQDLRKRGVKSDIIDQALGEVFDRVSVKEEALRQAKKRWPRLSYEEDPRKRKKKLSDFLARRGYPFEVIRGVIEEVAD